MAGQTPQDNPDYWKSLALGTARGNGSDFLLTMMPTGVGKARILKAVEDELGPGSVHVLVPDERNVVHYEREGLSTSAIPDKDAASADVPQETNLVAVMDAPALTERQVRNVTTGVPETARLMLDHLKLPAFNDPTPRDVAVYELLRREVNPEVPRP